MNVGTDSVPPRADPMKESVTLLCSWIAVLHVLETP